MKLLTYLSIGLSLLSTTAIADILNVKQITPNIYAIVGPLSQPSPENLGNNATFGLVITDGGGIIDSVKIDQSAFSYLQNYEGLYGRNAQEVFSQMEWE